MNAVIAFALKHRVLMVVLFVMILAGGVLAFRQLNIEAYPDPTPPMVDVITQSPGLSAEEIERYITIPIETQTAGLRNLTSIRTISLYGLSDVKLQFSFDFTYEEALQQVLNRLAQLPPLPNNAQPQISPVSPIGEVYRYKLVGPPGYSVLDLKTLQDWVLQRRFRAVPGVIDVTGWGGKTKTFELQVDFNKLIAAGLTLPQLLTALNNSNINVGGNTVNIGSQSAVVRGVGLIRSLDELSNTMLTQANGSPVLVRDVATVQVGYKPRLGIAGKDDDDDIVQGIVLMRRGEQSMPTITRVKQEVERINNSNILPPGVRIERIYDRSDLIGITTNTVLHNMVFGIALIFILQWMFLGNLRSALIVAATIPFALFFAVGILVLRGESANLLSVGAIDFGLIVDATVIMVESIYRRLSEITRNAPTVGSEAAEGLSGKLLSIFQAAGDVNRSIFFAAGIIIAGFLPLFTLSGVEGHIFGPMAKTYAYALAGGLLATFTVTPALSAILLPEHVEETETFLVRWMHRIYTPALHFCVANKGLTIASALALLLVAGVVRALARSRVPAQARRGQPVDPSHDADHHLARGGQRLRQPDADADRRLSRGGVRGLAAGAARRRHRRGGLLQRRVLHAAQAGQPVASRRRQGRAHGPDPGQAAGRISRRRIQLLAIPAGQRRRGGLRRERREFDQAVRQRPQCAERNGEQDQIGAVHRTGHRRSGGVHLARPADGADRHRPRARGALRAHARRHQRDHPRGDRRRCGRRPLRARQRPALPDRGAARAAVPAEPGGDPEPADRSAGAERHHDPDSAQRGRHGQARLRRLLHLPRGTGALSARSSSACATATSAAPSRRRSARSPSRCNCRPARAWNGSANSATCRTPSPA